MTNGDEKFITFSDFGTSQAEDADTPETHFKLRWLRSELIDYHNVNSSDSRYVNDPVN